MATFDLQQKTNENNNKIISESKIISLRCPKCNIIFTIDDFENSDLSKAHFQQFEQKITENVKKEVEKECESRLIAKFQYDFKNKTRNLELEKDKEIAQQINKKIEDFNAEKESLTKKFNEELNSIKINNQELKAKIDQFNLEKDKEIAQQINKKIEDFNAEKESLTKKFNEELNSTKIKNQELKAKIDQFNLEKDKEIAQQINKKIEDFNAEKESLTKKFNEELKQSQKAIHDLELENQKNKLINNKIQGDNLEQEIEEELSKTFLLDSISKITTTGKKADLLQKVKIDGTDEFIATITYEIKSTKDWSNNWEPKFADDMRKTNARYGIITATAFTAKYGKKIFAISEFNPNIYFCSHENVTLVAQIIRMFIITEYKLANVNKDNNDLEKKISKIREWKKIDFPSFSSKIKNAIDKLELVKNAISNQIPPLEKNINIIKDNFINEIERNLNLLIF